MADYVTMTWEGGIVSIHSVGSKKKKKKKRGKINDKEIARVKAFEMNILIPSDSGDVRSHRFPRFEVG